jgi:hypothetical protein
MKKLATLLALIAALAVAVPFAAQARHAADDPFGHVRHGGDDRTGDDSRSRRSTVKAKAKATGAARTDRRGRGADDAPGRDHGGHGTDDGPHHG